MPPLSGRSRCSRRRSAWAGRCCSARTPPTTALRWVRSTARSARSSSSAVIPLPSRRMKTAAAAAGTMSRRTATSSSQRCHPASIPRSASCASSRGAGRARKARATSPPRPSTPTGTTTGTSARTPRPIGSMRPSARHVGGPASTRTGNGGASTTCSATTNPTTRWRMPIPASTTARSILRSPRGPTCWPPGCGWGPRR